MKTGINSREFTGEGYGQLISHMSAFFSGITIKDNLYCNVIENVEVPANTEIKISHNLKKEPKFRIILKKFGDAIIDDGEGPWTDKYITIRNNDAANDCIVTLCILGG